MDRPAIALFDSGIGGLTVAAAIARALPHEDILYLGDTARLPYGTKSAATVMRYAERAVAHLLRYPVKALVVACNTASAYGLTPLGASVTVPLLGVIEPGARAALRATRRGHVGIAGTEATIRSGAYQRTLRALEPDIQITAHPWPLLVPLAEQGWIDDDPVADLTLIRYLEPMIRADVDTIVLGCTHYPVFKRALRRLLDGHFRRADVSLVDSAETVAQDLVHRFDEERLHAPPRQGRRLFLCTDDPERFARVGTPFFPDALDEIRLVDL